jgi:CheY-like chemotaxis protein
MNKKILIVDDEKDFANLLKMRLEGTGIYEATCVNESKNVLAQVRLFKPDVILLDLLMSGMGGFEICDMLNNDPAGCGIPVIVVSAISDETDKARAFKLGAANYLVKPIDDKTLLATIEKAIKEKSGNA